MAQPNVCHSRKMSFVANAKVEEEKKVLLVDVELVEEQEFK